MATPMRRTRLLSGLAALLVAAGWVSAGAARAAITSFTLSPASGPPATVVIVGSSGCSPGLTVSAASDYVAVTAPTLQVSTRVPVTGYGLWHGSFTVPAGASPAAAVVAALCVSDGLPSLTTLYTPQTFTVTAPPATTLPTTTTTPGTTNPTTPTTKRHSTGSTTPPTDGNPKPGGGGGSGSTVPVFGGVPPDSSRGSAGTTPGSENGGSGNGGSGTTRPRAVQVDISRAAQARAADLSVPGLSAARVQGSGGLGWLAWLLLLALVVAAVAAPYWLRRSRQRAGDTPEPGPAA